ncbi:MAG TPA: MG2 domain-containing protein, partial [Paludibacteraceae bacterium]|nr:MG2 domain-containing protein [Paludibacteraceae bacterium]
SYGIYEIKVAENENLSESEAALGAFVVSDFTCLTRSNRPDNQSIYALDRCTGKRISDVQVKTYDFKWNGKEYQSQLLHQTKTDKNGFCYIPTKSTYFQTNLFLEKGEDCYFSTVSFVQFYEPQRTATEKVQVNLFTDRSIYRPGQTVYFKGIAYFSDAKRQEVDKFSKYEVSLFDANHQKINSKTFTTNEFGSFTGTFILPENGLNGTFTLECSGFSASFQVEEYKRPTFEVKLEKPLSEISFGENVLLKGNAVAYAGYPVTQASVTYRIVRRNHYLWWYPEVKEIANGKTVTDENGNFVINFIPIKDQKKKEQYYTYTIYVSVTDTKGETQQVQQTISVGDKSLFILAEIPNKWDKAEKLCINVSLETLNGNKIDGKLNYAIYQ